MTPVPTLEDTIARANLHGDPIVHVLEFLQRASDDVCDAARVVTATMEKTSREPIRPDQLAEIQRFAASGAMARVTELIRVTDRKTRWIRASWWLASVVAAGAAGYALR